jgi:cytochrome c
LTETDTQSGVDHIYYKIDSGAWSEYASPFTLTEDGSHEVSYYAVDTTGNIETTKTAEIHIDQSLPEITLAKQQIDLLTVKFTAQVSDEPSGIDRVEFSLDGQPQITDMQSPYEWTYSGIGDHQVTATVFDMAGNSKSQSMSTPYTVTLMKQSVQQQVQGFLIKQQTLQ